MKMPKYIEKSLDKRAYYAYKFNEVDYMVSEWLTAHNVPVEDYDCYGGCESIVNPTESINRIKEAIKNS